MADGTVGGQAPTPDELHHRLQRAIFDPAPAQIGHSDGPTDRALRRKFKPAVPGWHSEEDAARLLGEHIQTRRKKRQRGIGPKWVRHGRDILYPDGAEEEYLAGLLKKAEAERELPRRGRPRKAVR